jgi:lipoprotein-anchoring transpeptidase ErfK/SrfK
MTARDLKKVLMLAVVGMWGLVVFSTLVSAQQWDQPDDPDRQVPQGYSQHDGYDSPYGGDQYDNDRDGPRAENRYYDPGNNPRRYDPRYNGDQSDSRYEEPRYPGPRVDRRDDEEGSRYGGRENYRDDYGAWDAAPSAEEEQRLSKTQGRNGGSRPYIRAIAPPKVSFSGPYTAGSIVIDTSARKLYYVLSPNSAYAYSIGVGRQGFAWTGNEKVSRIADWPDWYPPADMRKRQPYLPVRMLGGIRNPLGAKAIYLGNTLYRIHGTNDPKSIGKAESSGCFRMLNENVLHLASLVHVGTEVTIVHSLSGRVASAAKAPAPRKSASKGVRQTPPRIINHDADDEPDGWDPYNGWH